MVRCRVSPVAPRANPVSDSRKYCVSRATELAASRPGVALALDEDIELLEVLARADGHAGQGRFGQMHRHLRLLAQALREALQQGSAADEHDAPVHDVARQLGGVLSSVA